MTRILIILTTLAAFTASAFGLPVHLRTCRMMSGNSAGAIACNRCQAPGNGVVGSSPSDDAGCRMTYQKSPCCADQVIIHQLASYRLPIIKSACVAIPLHLIHRFRTLPGVPLLIGNAWHRMALPPLLRHSQTTYLLNSAFLI